MLLEVLIVFGLFLLFIICIIEIAFRFYYHKQHGRNYHVSIKFQWNDNHVVTHPFLSFAYKRNTTINKNQKIPYELHPNEYFSFKQPLRLNNLGHFGEDFSNNKPDGVIRIACLGDSTTANNIADSSRDYCYPSLLMDLLNVDLQKKEIPSKIEVFNCGIGGWVSVDIMIDFLLNILPTQPDYVIICHGFTDLHLYLTEDFSQDYSHGRYNLGERIGRIKWGYYFPKIPFWHSYEFLKDHILGTGNVRNEVLSAIRKQNPDMNRPFHDLSVEQNIIRNILIICQYHHIKCILSSYPFFPYKPDIKTLKIQSGVNIENQKMKELAQEFNYPFVDQAALIPKTKEYFLDWVHLTPEGMKLMAENFANAIIEDFRKTGVYFKYTP